MPSNIEPPIEGKPNGVSKWLDSKLDEIFAEPNTTPKGKAWKADYIVTVLGNAHLEDIRHHFADHSTELVPGFGGDVNYVMKAANMIHNFTGQKVWFDFDGSRYTIVDKEGLPDGEE